MKPFINFTKQLTTVLIITFITGCVNQPIPQNTQEKPTTKNETIKSDSNEEFERTISYQDIITKINDINTKKKNNQRIKEIVKEYQYNVSDDDSKNSAREKALNQVKVIILEEIGVFVESYLELNKIVTDEKYHEQFKQEIKNLTAGIIKTKILDENYNGKQYYVKASVLVDPDSVSEGISEILKIKANQSEIKKLNALLVSKENEIDMRSQETITLQKKITSQEFLNRAKEEELKTIQTQLQQAQLKLQKYEVEERKIRTELDRILNRINSETNDVQRLVYQGMTYGDVKKVMGSPNSTESCLERTYYNYGRKWVVFKSGIVYTLKDVNDYKGACHPDSYR